MRIVYLAESEIPSRAANSVHVMKMCHAFAALGHDVHLLVPDVADGDTDVYDFYGVARNFAIHRLKRGNRRGMRTWFALKSAFAARRLRPHLVYGRFLHGCWAAALLRMPVAYESHAPEREVSAQSARLAERLLRSPRLRRLVVISNALQRFYAQQYPHVADKIAVIPDAADEIPSGVTPIALQGKNGRLQIGYVGQLYAGKGMELVAALAARCPWADFHVVGGAEADIATWQQRLATNTNVRFHGFVPPRDGDRYRLAFDVVLAPYQRTVHGHASATDIGAWMSPLKIFEYMAARRPIVASDIPVLREILRDGETAFLRDPEDPDAWARVLAELRDAPELRAQIGQQGYEEFREHFTWRRRAERLLGLLGTNP